MTRKTERFTRKAREEAKERDMNLGRGRWREVGGQRQRTGREQADNENVHEQTYIAHSTMDIHSTTTISWTYIAGVPFERAWSRPFSPCIVSNTDGIRQW
jgi:hypothetical protein